MVDTLGNRLAELRDEAHRLRRDDSDFDVPDTRIAIGAYADLLDLSPTLVYDLSLSLSEIRRLGTLV